MLESEMLELKANPNKAANGSVIEARLDKGKGYITTLLVQNGSLSVGDYFLVGQYSGKVRALYDERGNQIGPFIQSCKLQITCFNSCTKNKTN